MNVEDYVNIYLNVTCLNVQYNNELVLVYNLLEQKNEILNIIKNKPFKKLCEEANFAICFKHENILSAKKEETLITETGKVKILTYKKCDCDLYDFLFFLQVKLSKEQLYNIFEQMVKAVEFLHDNDMPHCDIKLKNFLVDNKDAKYPHVYLTDFNNMLNTKEEKKNKANNNYNNNNNNNNRLSPLLTKKKKKKLKIKKLKKKKKKKSKKYKTKNESSETNSKDKDVYALGVCLKKLLTYETICNKENPFSKLDPKDGSSGLNFIEHDLIKKMLNNQITIKKILLHPLFK
eukprot:TRINITY_DN347_c0_g1_i1.p1 TRINITY_DN347_c0_g1~~TRINITY_DN347_c0_g1_i1.p1  ORF type:complete len:290 (-),score=65.49 TRINITY_DN347_c0_g1_i1:38-907(-)